MVGKELRRVGHDSANDGHYAVAHGGGNSCVAEAWVANGWITVSILIARERHGAAIEGKVVRFPGCGSRWY